MSRLKPMHSRSALSQSIRPADSGFTIIELLIALTVGLLLLTSMTLIYVSNSSYRTELDRSSRMIENGVFAIDRMTDDMRKAGYYGDFDMGYAVSANLIQAPTAKPDPCVTALASVGQPQTVPPGTLNSPLVLPVQGYDAPDATTAPTRPATCNPYIAPAELTAGSDVIVIRRTDTCVAGPTAAAGCDAPVAGRPYLQASQCTPFPPAAATELAGTLFPSVGNSGWFKIESTTANLTLHKIDCNSSPPGATANYRRYLVNIYYVAKNDNAGDGIPTLKLAQLDGVGGARTFTVTPLAEGIETLQFEYGLDTNQTGACNMAGDGTPDEWTADPDNFVNCTAAAVSAANAVANWASVVAVKVHLLARNTQPAAPGLVYVNNKTFNLGFKADGTANTFGPFGDAYRRHVYATMVRLYNSAGRRQL